MSKFKVIEESRFLKNNLMKEITGGVIINSGTCTILSAHDGCGGSSRILLHAKNPRLLCMSLQIAEVFYHM